MSVVSGAMPTKPLGHSGLQVSVIGLGTMTWGEQNTQADAFAQLNRAVDAGVNLVDTAEVYAVPIKEETYGLTETYIGHWLAEDPSRRERIVLASKVAGVSRRMHWVRGAEHKLNRANIVAAAEASLQRLQTEYLDLYQLHWPDRTTNVFGQRYFQLNPEEEPFCLEETLRAVAELIAAGKIRYWGLSNETPWGTMHYLRLAEQLGLPKPVSIQNPYSLLNRSYEVGMAEISLRENVGLLSYSPLAGGALSGKYLNGACPTGSRMALFPGYFSRYSSATAQRALEAYAALAQEHGLSLTQMALAFVNQQPFNASTLIGATTMAQLEENLASASVVLSPELLAAIDTLGNTFPSPSP